MIGSSLALAHTSFSRLLRDWLVWKYADPNLAAALHEARHGHTARFNLAVGDPPGFKHLQAEIPEGQRTAAPGLTGHAPALLLAVLHFLWHQHKSALPKTRPWFALPAFWPEESRPCTPSTSPRSRRTWSWLPKIRIQCRPAACATADGLGGTTRSARFHF